MHNVTAKYFDFWTILLSGTFIVNDAFNNLNKLSDARHPERFLPQSGRLITDNEDRRMIIFLLDVLAQFVECPIEVLLLAGQKNPTRTSVKLLRVFLHSRGRVSLRVDCHRYEKDVAADAVAESFLNLLHVAIHWWTHRSATGEKGVDHDSLAFEH